LAEAALHAGFRCRKFLSLVIGVVRHDLQQVNDAPQADAEVRRPVVLAFNMD
jgi:hypothetical protein